jgi:hypothetical protein
LGIEEIGQGTALLPDDLFEEGEGFPFQIGSQFGGPMGKALGMGLEMIEAIQVEPFVGEHQGTGAGARIVLKTVEVRGQVTGVVEFAGVQGTEEFLIGWRAPIQVTQADGEFVVFDWPGGAVAALVLDAIEELGCLEHGFESGGHGVEWGAASGEGAVGHPG